MKLLDVIRHSFEISVPHLHMFGMFDRAIIIRLKRQAISDAMKDDKGNRMMDIRSDGDTWIDRMYTPLIDTDASVRDYT